MGIFDQIAEYLFLKKKDPNRPNSSFIRAMHGINRISIFMFLFGIIIIFYKVCVRK
jgi:hypothetical protein